MEKLSIFLIFVGFFLLMMIQLRAHKNGLPLWGNLFHEKMFEDLDSIDIKLVKSGISCVLFGIVMLCLSFFFDEG